MYAFNEFHDDQSLGTLKQTHRHSLQPVSSPHYPKFRHTRSERTRKPKRVLHLDNFPSIPAPITEVVEDVAENGELRDDKTTSKVTVENELQRKISRISDESEEANKGNNSGENSTFDGVLSDALPNTSEAPSLKSLEVVREQYCCCSRRTNCERALLATVTILTIAIIVLVITVIILSTKNKTSKNIKNALGL